MPLFSKKDGVLICADALLLPGGLPIYDDAEEAVTSIKKLQALAGVKFLLSSWDEPVSGEVIGQKMDQSIGYFKTLHEAISEIEDAKNLAPLALCKMVVTKLGLPPAAVNPLVAKSFQSNVANLDQDIFH